MAGDEMLAEKAATAEPCEREAAEAADAADAADAAETTDSPEPPPHSVFPPWQRAVYVYMASLAAFTSPVSSSIYYPAMQSIATDLHTSLTRIISLSITTYMVGDGGVILFTGTGTGTAD